MNSNANPRPFIVFIWHAPVLLTGDSNRITEETTNSCLDEKRAFPSLVEPGSRHTSRVGDVVQ